MANICYSYFGFFSDSFARLITFIGVNVRQCLNLTLTTEQCTLGLCSTNLHKREVLPNKVLHISPNPMYSISNELISTLWVELISSPNQALVASLSQPAKLKLLIPRQNRMLFGCFHI